MGSVEKEKSNGKRLKRKSQLKALKNEKVNWKRLKIKNKFNGKRLK
jgi:hypothetical protein